MWRSLEDSGTDLLFPPEFAMPKGVVHFVGGAVVGGFPRASYGPLLERVAKEVSVRACVCVRVCECVCVVCYLPR